MNTLRRIKKQNLSDIDDALEMIRNACFDIREFSRQHVFETPEDKDICCDVIGMMTRNIESKLNGIESSVSSLRLPYTYEYNGRKLLPYVSHLTHDEAYETARYLWNHGGRWSLINPDGSKVMCYEETIRTYHRDN